MENPKERIEDILKRNPYLDAKVGLGYDNFLDFTCGRQKSQTNLCKPLPDGPLRL